MSVDHLDTLFLVFQLPRSVVGRLDALVVGLVLTDGDLLFGDLEAVQAHCTLHVGFDRARARIEVLGDCTPRIPAFTVPDGFGLLFAEFEVADQVPPTLGGVLVGVSVFHSDVLVGMTVKIWLGSREVDDSDSEHTNRTLSAGRPRR